MEAPEDPARALPAFRLHVRGKTFFTELTYELLLSLPTTGYNNMHEEVET